MVQIYTYRKTAIIRIIQLTGQIKDYTFFRLLQNFRNEFFEIARKDKFGSMSRKLTI